MSFSLQASGALSIARLAASRTQESSRCCCSSAASRWPSRASSAAMIFSWSATAAAQLCGMSLPRKRMRFMRACSCACIARSTSLRAMRTISRWICWLTPKYSMRSRLANSSIMRSCSARTPAISASVALRAGELARERLHARDDGEHVARLARADAADDRAAVGLDLDQPLDGEHLEGLAQRRARDCSFSHSCFSTMRLPSRQMPLDDQVAQPRRHRLVQRAPRDRAARVGRRERDRAEVCGGMDHGHRIIIGISSTTDGNSVRIASVISSGG